MVRVKTLLGDYPVTAALKSGAVASKSISPEFSDVKRVHHAFKRVVRDLEFDIAELAVVTYLLARAHGKPYRLLPAVISARFQHPFLVCNAERPLKPEELSGKRVGQRSYSVTTATWIRGILADDCGVDLDSIRWTTFEEPHVAEFRDPPNVARAPAGKDIAAMLLAGELDAAIMTDIPNDPRIRPMFADPKAAAAAWRRRTGASVQINHMVVAKNTVPAGVSDEFSSLLEKSKAAAGDPGLNPFGIEENRRNLEAAIDCVYRQKMIPRRFSVDELFTPC
jgi:4,5-dihydroxyphthalate decarboxylase